LLFLGLIVLSFLVRQSHHRHEALKSFALFKPIEKLSPEDCGFQVLQLGERPDTGKRPFYSTYLTRSASEEGSNRAYTEAELAEALREGKGFVLLGQPLDGKSRTLYEIVMQMAGYRVVRPSPSKGLPQDEEFSLLEGERVILLLEDLHNYVGRRVDLLEFHRKLVDHTSSCVVAATCRDGPEQRAVEANLGQFYEEIELKLRLAPPTAEEKGRLAETIGEDWDPEKINDYPTLGSITMERPMAAMALRFNNLLHEHPQIADTQRALKLLSAAGILPFTHRRIEAVLRQVFGRREIHLHDYLRVLANESFLQAWEPLEETVQPEPAYLKNSVTTYTEGKETRDDFPKLADTLEEMQDYEGLVGLGIIIFLGNREGQVDLGIINLARDSLEQALSCLDRATDINPEYPYTWLNKSVILYALGRYHEALVALERDIRLRPNNVSAWQNKANLLEKMGRYQEAVESRNRVVELKPGDANAWRNLGSAYNNLDRYRDALSAYNRSIDLRKTEPDSWFGRALALSWLNRNREALRAYNRVTNLSPDHFEAWINKALVLKRLTRYKDAAVAAGRATNLRPDFPGAWAAKGDALMELARQENSLDRWEDTFKAYDRATDLDADYAECWSLKGVALTFLARYWEASRSIERAIALRPDNPQDWYYKAQVLIKKVQVEGQLLSEWVEFAAGMWWLCRAWRARDELPDRGELVARTFEQIPYNPVRCEQDFPLC
jgi:tetratricopeptide (TPR) repeat protein